MLPKKFMFELSGPNSWAHRRKWRFSVLLNELVFEVVTKDSSLNFLYKKHLILIKSKDRIFGNTWYPTADIDFSISY